MLTRIYVDNFRCLVNFELRLDRLNLLLGENGSGRTTVFDVLRRLQGFLGGDLNVDAAFPSVDLTRWQQLDVQRFEMDIKLDDAVYAYDLSIKHQKDGRTRQVMRERLRVNERLLIEADEVEAQLFTDGPKPRQVIYDSRYSGVASLPDLAESKPWAPFRRQLAMFAVVGFCPTCMAFEPDQEEKRLTADGSNFPSWYRYLSQEHQGNILTLTEELRKVLPGFDSFSLREAGEKTRVLKVLFRSGNQSGKPIAYNFDELSDGQRELIALYSLLYGVQGEGYSLFLDEPDNYVALREIQPWLTSLQDACGDAVSQAVLISHHPEVIDYLAGSGGLWFDRPDNGPTRVQDKMPATDGLKTSETIARGLTS